MSLYRIKNDWAFHKIINVDASGSEPKYEISWEPTWESWRNVQHYKNLGWHPRRVLQREGQMALIMWEDTWEPLSVLLASDAGVALLRFYLVNAPAVFKTHVAQFPRLREIL